MNMEMILILLAGAVSVSLLVSRIMHFISQRSVRKRLRKDEAPQAVSKSLIDSVLKPIFSSYAPFFQRFQWPARRAKLDRLYAYAGLEGYSHEDFWAFQTLSPFLITGFFYLLTFELRLLDIHYALPWWTIPLCLVLGYYFPILWIHSLIKKRQSAILLEFPSFVDRLTLSVEAGLDFMAAMTRIMQKMAPSPLQGELKRMISGMQIGSTRSQALRHLKDRIGLRDVSIFAATLIQADRLGTSIGHVLRAQSDRLRRERFEAAERKGAIAAQKLLFPLVFFIMPAVFIVVFGPLLVKLITGGLEGLTL